MSLSNGTPANGTAYQWIIGVLLILLMFVTGGVCALLMNQIGDIKNDVRSIQKDIVDFKVFIHDFIAEQVIVGAIPVTIEKLKVQVDDRIKNDETAIRSLEQRIDDLEKRSPKR